MPRNEIISEVKLAFPDDAHVEEPTPYRYGPVLYYGSSITEGGCCCRMTNAYNALLSNRLDIDYYNFGFSGSAKGELIMADYINTIPIKAFVYDYDHNAPNAEHLSKTHEAFFLRIREKQPDLPILMMGCPDFDYVADAKKRREVIYTTYQNALARGDKTFIILTVKPSLAIPTESFAPLTVCIPTTSASTVWRQSWSRCFVRSSTSNDANVKKETPWRDVLIGEFIIEVWALPEARVACNAVIQRRN